MVRASVQAQPGPQAQARPTTISLADALGGQVREKRRKRPRAPKALTAVSINGSGAGPLLAALEKLPDDVDIVFMQETRRVGSGVRSFKTEARAHGWQVALQDANLTEASTSGGTGVAVRARFPMAKLLGFASEDLLPGRASGCVVNKGLRGGVAVMSVYLHASGRLCEDNVDLLHQLAGVLREVPMGETGRSSLRCFGRRDGSRRWGAWWWGLARQLAAARRWTSSWLAAAFATAPRAQRPRLTSGLPPTWQSHALFGPTTPKPAHNN